VGLVGGIVAGPFEKLAEAAGEVSFGAPTPLDARTTSSSSPST